MPRALVEKITEVEKLAPDICSMTIRSEYIAQNSKAGQFVHVKCSEGNSPLLRRPFSICSADREKNLIRIVFQVKGEGTMLLSGKKPGDDVDIIGPLGNSFVNGEVYDRIAVIGGGIGIFPLLYLLQESAALNKYAYLGLRDISGIVLKKEFEQASDGLHISTEDGSCGYKGLITDLFESHMHNESNSLKPDIIYACGPLPMLRKVSELAGRYNLPCRISMEERMGCGVGACLVCACKTKLGEGWQYSRVCKEGPVFWSREVIFE